MMNPSVFFQTFVGHIAGPWLAQGQMYRLFPSFSPGKTYQLARHPASSTLHRDIWDGPGEGRPNIKIPLELHSFQAVHKAT